MGKKVFRSALSGVYVLVSISFLVIFQKNIENLGQRAGFNDILGRGYDIVSALGFQFWFLLVFAAMTGAMLVVWGEVFVRKLLRKRAIHNCAHLVFSFDNAGRVDPCSEKGGVTFGMTVDGQLYGKIHEAEPKASRLTCTLIIVFEQPLTDPVAHVASDRKIIWREVYSSDQCVVLEFDPRVKQAANVRVIVRPEKWAAWGRWIPTPMQWQDANVVPVDILSRPIVPPRFTDWIFQSV